MTVEKRCTRCGETKLLSEYYNKRTAADGRRSECKACCCAMAKAWREADPQRARESWGKSREKHREKRLADTRAWREKNREELLARRREQRAEDLDAARAAGRAEYRSNPVARRESSRRWAERNPEKVRENWRVQGQRKYARDPEKMRELGRVRAHARRGTVARDPVAGEYLDYMRVLLRDPCSYCGGVADTIDHIVPLSKGGTNSWDNLTAACGACNSSKGDRSLLVFLAERVPA